MGELIDQAGFDQWFVALDVDHVADVRVPGDDLGDAVGAGRVVGGGHHHPGTERLGGGTDAFVVGGDQQFIKGLPDGPVPFHYPAEDYEQELMRSHSANRWSAP